MTDFLNGQPTKFKILKDMMEYVTENDVSDDWKNDRLEFLEDACYTLLDPEIINPWIQDANFRELVRRLSTLAGHIYETIHSGLAFDVEVFKLMVTYLLKVIEVCDDEDVLVESMQSVTL